MYRSKILKMVVVTLVSAVLIATIGGSLATAQERPKMVQVWLDKAREAYAGKTVTIAAISHPSTRAFEKYIGEFEEATGIKVRWDIVAEGAYFNKAPIVLKSGRYDIAYGCIEVVGGWDERGLMTDLEPYIKGTEGIGTPDWFVYEDFPLAYRDLLVWKGKTLGIPFAGEASIIFYRKDTFEKYGKQPPETFQDLLELAKFFDGKDWDNDGKEDAGITFRAFPAAAYQWGYFLYPFGVGFVDPESREPTLNTPEAVESLRFFVELGKYGPTGIESFDFPEAWSAYMEGKAPLMIEASAAAPEIEDPWKSIAVDKTGYLKMPRTPAGSYAGVWGWGLFVPPASKNKEAAWATIVWLTSKYNQDKYLEYGGVVTRTSALENAELQERYLYYKAVLEALEQSKNLIKETGRHWCPKLVKWREFSQIMNGYISKAFVGKLTPEEACELMQEEVDKLRRPL